MDVIFVRKLKAETVVGIYGWERKTAQPVVLDLELATPHSRACQSDDIGDAIDYSTLVTEVRDLLARSRFNLLERLADEVAGHLLQRFGSPWVRVSISKAFALAGAEAGVSVERGRPLAEA